MAKTPPTPYEMISNFMGFSAHKYCFDLCVLKENFEKRNDFDAELQPYRSSISFNNFPWGNAKTHLPRMAKEFIEKKQSFIIVANVKVDEREYFKKWIQCFIKDNKLPPMTFGGYDRKLDHGVAIIYLLQPEWWDHIYHKDRVKNRKA